jgi:hypothetical protein
MVSEAWPSVYHGCRPPLFTKADRLPLPASWVEQLAILGL